MKIINSLSGGKTSSYIAANYAADYDVFSLVRTMDNASKFKDEKVRRLVEDRIQAPFISTAEDDTIIYTMLDLEQYIGRKIVWVTGPTFDDVIKNHSGYLPNKVARYCTTDMKTLPIAKWRYDNIKGDVEMRFGFRANEQGRAKKMFERCNEKGMVEVKIITGRSKNNKRNKWEVIDYCKPTFPLIKDALFKDSIEEFWKDKPVRFAYINNCVGCWWRSPMLLKHMADKHPLKMDWFARQEEGNKGQFKSDVSYREIISYNSQYKLFDEDFDECDTGYCGI
tara:strand:- start:233 stop:1075 length:843 start_codon:yes stop_codon:yes gene_type:complete